LALGATFLISSLTFFRITACFFFTPRRAKPSDSPFLLISNDEMPFAGMRKPPNCILPRLSKVGNRLFKKEKKVDLMKRPFLQPSS